MNDFFPAAHSFIVNYGEKRKYVKKLKFNEQRGNIENKVF